MILLEIIMIVMFQTAKACEYNYNSKENGGKVKYKVQNLQTT